MGKALLLGLRIFQALTNYIAYVLEMKYLRYLVHFPLANHVTVRKTLFLIEFVLNNRLIGCVSKFSIFRKVRTSGDRRHRSRFYFLDLYQ